VTDAIRQPGFRPPKVTAPRLTITPHRGLAAFRFTF